MKEKTAAKQYKIVLYGKKNCDKCDALKKRVERVLKKEEYASFSLQYHDLTTREGLVAMAKGETINGQRVPAIQLMKSERDCWYKIRDPREEALVDGKLFVPVYLQLDTDYSNSQRAVVKPEDIECLLNLALIS